MSARTAWKWKRAAPRSGRSIRAPVPTAIFAGGLRNPVGIAFNPASGQLWTAVNERDELGSDLVPDYITSVRDGGFYGWPYSYSGQHVDTRVKPPRPDLVAGAIEPDYALGPHIASLGLTFSDRRNGSARASPAAHSSASTDRWNRNPPSGYSVIFVPFAGAQPSGMPVEVLTGFMSRRQGLRPPGRSRRSPATARCSSPTMSAARSGG